MKAQCPLALTADDTPRGETARRRAVWPLLAVGAALALGFANLAGPSLWHDELVHVYVGKSVAETGTPRLPSGQLYYNATIYNYILGGFIALFGDAERAVRAPSVLFAGLSVWLTYALARRLLGHTTAVVAAFALALSPWSVAWARQARFYMLQQVFYLVLLGLVWVCLHDRNPRRAAWGAAGAALAYLGSVLISLHSVLFVAPVAGFAFCVAAYERRWISRWGATAAAAAVLGAATVVLYRLTLPPLDQIAVFTNVSGGAEHIVKDYTTSSRLFYAHWIQYNLSSGYFYLMLVGSAALLIRGGRRGFFVLLGFWAPFLLLSVAIIYRQDRFMFFTWPFYQMLTAYGLVFGVEVVAGAWAAARDIQARGPRPAALLRIAAGAAILVFGARLAVSTIRLAGDTLETARGAHVTLARRHPQWREPCRQVRERLTPDTVVVTTTFLPVRYYVGRVDNWYPSADMWWEEAESGLPGLRTLEEFQDYVRAHPRGFYLAEWRRFGFIAAHGGPPYAAAQAWIDEHLVRLEDASSADVTVYAWGLDAGPG